MNRFADEPEVQPSNKKKGNGLKILIVVLALGGTAVALKWASSTRDPKTMTAGVSKAAVDDAASVASDANKNSMVSTMGADGGIQRQGEEQERQMRHKMEADVQEAKRQAEERQTAKDKGDQKRRRGTPGTIDPATGLPREDDGTSGDEPATQGQAKAGALPEPPKGWDPEKEIFVAPGQGGGPGYRYQPAYMRGSDIPYDQTTMTAWDARWLASAQAASIGKHIASSNTYSKLVGEIQIANRGGGGSTSVRARASDLPVQQPGTPTPVKKVRSRPVRVQIYPSGGAR